MDFQDEWFDITDDLGEGAIPTLSRDGGCGVIQFTLATYSGGDAPNVSTNNLTDMVRTFFEGRDSSFEPMAMDPSHSYCAGGSSNDEGVTCLWYVSNGKDLAMVTYVSNAGFSETKDERASAKRLVESISFPDRQESKASFWSGIRSWLTSH